MRKAGARVPRAGVVVWGVSRSSAIRQGAPRVRALGRGSSTPPEERYRELFRAARAVRRAGIEDENQILPTLAFAARSFELPNLKTLGDRLAGAEVGGEEVEDLEGHGAPAFDTFEFLRVQDGVPIFYSRPFKLRAHAHQGTGGGGEGRRRGVPALRQGRGDRRMVRHPAFEARCVLRGQPRRLRLARFDRSPADGHPPLGPGNSEIPYSRAVLRRVRRGTNCRSRTRASYQECARRSSAP